MLSNLLRRMDVGQLEEIFGTHISESGNSDNHVALDGKTLKNSGQEGIPAIHLLSLFSTKNCGVIGQIPMEAGNRVEQNRRSFGNLGVAPVLKFSSI